MDEAAAHEARYPADVAKGDAGPGPVVMVEEGVAETGERGGSAVEGSAVDAMAVMAVTAA